MAFTKPPYRGNRPTGAIFEFSDEIHTQLLNLYPIAGPYELHGLITPPEEFVQLLLAHGLDFHSELLDIDNELTRSEILAECEDLATRLSAAQHGLRNMSDEVLRLLPQSADVGELDDRLTAFIKALPGDSSSKSAVPARQRLDGRKRHAAREFALRALRVMMDYGISPSGTYRQYEKLVDITLNPEDPGESVYLSTAIKMIKIVADACGLKYSPATWRDLIAETKRSGPEL